MKSIERRFLQLQRQQPKFSSYICFASAIRGQKFGQDAIHRWFNKLVLKADYESSEKKDVLIFLENLSHVEMKLGTTENKALRAIIDDIFPARYIISPKEKNHAI